MNETDELAYVIAMGLDRGETNVVRVTLQVAIPSALAAGSDKGGEEGTEIISVEAGSLFGALQLANAFVSRKLTLKHNELVIISDVIAREGLDKYINPLIRSRDVRRDTIIAITQGSAMEFLKNNKKSLEKNPAREFAMSFGSKEYTALTFDTSLNDFNKSVKSHGSSPVLSLVGVKGEENKPVTKNMSYEEKLLNEVSYLPGEVSREGGNEVDIIGLAAFQGERLIGFLNGSETRYYMMLTDRFKSADFTFPDPHEKNKAIIVRITQGRNPERKVEISGEKPIIHIGLFLEGEILSIQSGINYEEPGELAKLDSYIADIIKSGVMALIRRTQEEFQCDIVGFGEETRKFFWTWQEWARYDWTDKYPAAEVQLEVTMVTRRTGLMRKTYPTAEGDVQ